MIWYKAWLESRWRFAIALAMIGAIVAADIFQASINMPRMGMAAHEFGRYVWKIYFTRFQLLWILSVLVLSMGGLLREQSSGTADFSLSLPVSRRRWMTVRVAMAAMQASALAFLPVVVVPLAATFAGHAYSPLDAARFSALVLATNIFVLMLGILFSTLFQGEYIGVALGIAMVFALAVVANPLAGRYPMLGMSYGEGYVDEAWRLVAWPVAAIAAKLILAAALWETANRVLERRSF